MFSNLGVYFERSTHIFSKIVADVYVTIAIETPVARKLLLPALGNVVLHNYSTSMQYQHPVNLNLHCQVYFICFMVLVLSRVFHIKPH
jgi:hypothetical protein